VPIVCGRDLPRRKRLDGMQELYTWLLLHSRRKCAAAVPSRDKCEQYQPWQH
jgi:hypothetical protein